MIPESLLIQVEPIWWIGGFTWYSLFVGMIIPLTLIIGYRGIRKTIEYLRMRKRKSIFLGKLPWIDSPDFLIDAAQHLRSAISHIYIPHHGYAHTAREITQYVDDPTIISLLSKIEHAEYGPYDLSREDRVSIITILEALREKIRKWK